MEQFNKNVNVGHAYSYQSLPLEGVGDTSPECASSGLIRYDVSACGFATARQKSPMRESHQRKLV